jgi:hypothetical protein
MQRRGRLRRSLYVLAAGAALLVSGPMLPLEMAVWFSGELLLYLEIVSGAWLASRAASWKALPLWMNLRVKRIGSFCRAVWLRSNPTTLSWLQSTLAFQ